MSLTNDQMNEAKDDAGQFMFATLRRLATEYHMPELRHVSIQFTLRGHSAGTANKRFAPNGTPYYFVNLNEEIFEKGTKRDVELVILHEIAHIICFINPRLGKNHDKGWKRVCLAIGGDGNRCHEIDLTPARKRYLTRHIYIVNGHTIKLTSVRHNQLRKGLRLKCKYGEVKKSHYSETIKLKIAK